MPRRIDISKINTSGIITLMLFGGLITAAVIRPPSEYRVPKITDEDRFVTAYHESGHAILAANLPASSKILKVTIVSRLGMLGSLSRAPVKESESTSRRHAGQKAEFIIAMGGLIAEEIFIPSSQATEAKTSDIKSAEKIAFDLLGGPDAGLSPVATETGVRRLTNEAERRARAILSSRQTQMHALAAHLLQHGTLSGAEIATTLEGGARKPRQGDTG